MSDQGRISEPWGTAPEAHTASLGGGAPERATTRPAGEVVAGKYRLLRLLGVGGMGEVHEAEHLRLGERVALKFLQASSGARPGAAARLVREAQLMARVRSPHVSSRVDVEELESGEPFVVMDLLEGCSLSQLLRERGALQVHEAVGLILQACEGLAAAHAVGVIHRDIKPSNLFLTPGGVLKVIDFGLAKARSSEGLDLTRSDAVFGSPLYMSPEQIRASREVDARTDIWSLGVTLYELLTGRTPFSAGTASAIVASIVTDAPRGPSQHAPVPRELEQIVLSCLEKLPSQRPSSVESLAAQIAPFAREGFAVPGRWSRKKTSFALLALALALVLPAARLSGGPALAASPPGSEPAASAEPAPAPLAASASATGLAGLSGFVASTSPPASAAWSAPSPSTSTRATPAPAALSAGHGVENKGAARSLSLSVPPRRNHEAESIESRR